jgi:hypothetical protein
LLESEGQSVVSFTSTVSLSNFVDYFTDFLEIPKSLLFQIELNRRFLSCSWMVKSGNCLREHFLHEITTIFIGLVESHLKKE